MNNLRYPFLFLCFLLSFTLQAQQNHFIYLQTDNKLPFYVKFEKKIYSSSEFGYLIISKLKAGVYNFIIGFPKNEWPEQHFICAVEDKDYGYLIKNFEDQRWGFFNLQTLNIVMASDTIYTNMNSISANNKVDTFSNILASVVKDPTIKIKTVEKKVDKPIVKEDIAPVNTVVKLDKSPTSLNNKVSKINDSVNLKVDTFLLAKKNGFNADKVPPPLNLITPPSHITKNKVNSTKIGVEMAFIDVINGVQDTINIFIPIEKDKVDSLIVSNDTGLKNKVVKVEPVNDTVISDRNQHSTIPPVNINNTHVGVSNTDSINKKNSYKSPIINSDCKNFASEDDFLKLRKKMASAPNGDNMIGIAKKTFKTKCFTTEQIKNLSVLFLKDVDKYNFFDTGYPFVSDSQNYPALQSQLTDIYFLNRFKVMIRH